MSDLSTIHHFHMCGGIGSGAAGMNDAIPEVGPISGKMVCTGGIDVDPKACADFKQLTGVTQACRDMFSLPQYQAFHGRMPPPGWAEISPADVRAASHGIFPDIVFTSSPCKGFSGLLSTVKSVTMKYVALNELTLRTVWLTLEAFGDDPPGLFVFENVPRIASRGRQLLDQIVALLRHYGYAVQETFHDCGEIGDLAQSRKRFLLVARHMKKVPAFLYEPVKRPLRAVGDVLRHMPLPGDPRGGPMHRVPELQWKTWVRLAFVRAGSDWRSLNELAVHDGNLRDYLIVPTSHEGSGPWGVNRWDEPTGTIAGRTGPSNGKHSVADPRFAQSDKWSDGQAYGVVGWRDHMGTISGQPNPGQGKFAVQDPRQALYSAGYGVTPWDASTGAVAGESLPSNGRFAVADPRHTGPAKHSNEFRIVRFDQAAQAVTSAHGTGQALADPRLNWSDGAHRSKMRVTAWEDPHGTVTGTRGPYSGASAVADPRQPGLPFAKYSVADWENNTRTVIAGSTTGEGAFAVADPRPNLNREKGDHYLTGGHYGVVRWEDHSYAVTAALGHDNGHGSVADPRLPGQAQKLVAVIRSMDNTWHRPFTTLELAALQSIIDPEEWFAPGGPGWTTPFVMEGGSDQRWREGIGNAVPRKAGKAIGHVMGQTILMSRLGETFTLSSQPVWVQPLALAASMPGAAA